jgi:peptidoglycan/xylan/chitin deacetylase (PgdA/CDA1 family)
VYLHKTPAFIQSAFKGFHWKIPDDNKIYLTFDDGPIPTVTDWVLDVLKDYQISATFFCVGDNIHKHNKIFQRIIDEHHGVGNHTYHHVDGWQTPADVYLENIKKCQSYFPDSSQKLFRPPYGRMNTKATSKIKQQYEVVMWDVLAGDFDQTLNVQSALTKCVSAVENGSIILFHDSLKAEKNLKLLLPGFIEEMKAKDFSFSKLPWR